MKLMKKKISTSKNRKDSANSNPVTKFESGYLSEPPITFGQGKIHVDPKTGISIWGPYNVKGQSQLSISNITIGIVGPKNMVGDAINWLKSTETLLVNDGKNSYSNPHFPGVNMDNSFRCNLTYGDTWFEVIKDELIDNALIGSYSERLNKIVRLYVERIGVLSQREPKPNVALLCIPQNIIDQCTVKIGADGKEERIKFNKSEKKMLSVLKTGQGILFDDLNPLSNANIKTNDHRNLRRGIKAEAMRHGIPTQIVWPRTLLLVESTSKKKELSSQDIATKAWNFLTALYYKAGGTPWRIMSLDSSACFVGISFYKDLNARGQMRSSMAQLFTSSGDGYVLRGNSFEWNERKNGRSPHLDKDSAKTLLGNVIQLYKQQNKGSLPSRIVLHKSSKFWDSEIEGFTEAANEIPNKDFVAFAERGIQFYRQGDYPVIRGTYIKISDENMLLYTTGYVPFYRTYNGPRTPKPLEVIQHIGDSPWIQVLEEILALTKMNWNTANFNCSHPITIAFSKKVGEVLAEMPVDLPFIKPEYRYYM